MNVTGAKRSLNSFVIQKMMGSGICRFLIFDAKRYISCSYTALALDPQPFFGEDYSYRVLAS